MLPYGFTIERIFDSRRYGSCRWYSCYDDVYWQRRTHSQRMLGNLARHCKSRSLSANQFGSVDGRSANRRSCNWRSKMHEKTKHSWL